MSAAIETLTIGTWVDKGVVLRNSQIFRKIRDNNWTKLNIGIRYSFVDDPGASPATGSVLSLGLCNGSDAGIGDATPRHCLAAATMSNAGAGVSQASWSRTTTEADYIYMQSRVDAFYRQRYVNGVRTSAGQWSSGLESTVAYLPRGSSFIARSALVFQVTRGSPNFSTRIITRTSTTSDVTVPTHIQFVTQIVANPPVFLRHTALSSANIAIDEATNGVLDHVNVWWNRTAPALFINDIAVTRIA